jgi:hypothetical protein
MINLTPEEIEIIKKLDSPIYTVAYLSEWINREDDVQINVVAALMACAAKGYYAAIKLMADKGILSAD